MSKISDQLNALRTRANLSMEKLAIRMGLKGASSIHRYFDDYPGEFFPIKITMKFADAMAGLGTPPITIQEVLALGEQGLIRRGMQDTQYSTITNKLSEEDTAKAIFNLLQQNNPHPAHDFDEIRELHLKCAELVGLSRQQRATR